MSSSYEGGEDKLVRTSFVRIPPEARQSGNARYSINDLIKMTGLSSRTIRYYISEGLIKAANGRGPTATYDRDHLLRLLRIVELKNEVTGIQNIKERIDLASTADLEAHFAVRNGPEEEQWRRIRVHPNLELHVQVSGQDKDYRFEHALEQILQHARIVLEAYDIDR